MTPEDFESAALATLALANAQSEHRLSETAIRHLSYVRNEIYSFLDNNRIDKASRWMGFFYGANTILTPNYVLKMSPTRFHLPEPVSEDDLRTAFIPIMSAAGPMSYAPERMDTSLKLPAIPLYGPSLSLLQSHASQVEHHLKNLYSRDLRRMFFLGVLQGTLWALGLASIDDLKTMNKPQA